MSDTDQQPATIHGPYRRFRRLIGVAALLCVLMLFVALMVWSARPRWYTFVSKPTTAPPTFALVLRVPAGWECKELHGLSDVIDVQIQREPLVGFAAWWNRVFHLDTAQQQAELSIVGYGRYPSDLPSFPELSGDPDDCIRKLKQYEQQSWSPPNGQMSLSVLEHTLGPALEETISIRGSQTIAEEWCKETSIVLRQHTKRVCELIAAAYSAQKPPSRRTQALWDEIVESIRVVH